MSIGDAFLLRTSALQRKGTQSAETAAMLPS